MTPIIDPSVIRTWSVGTIGREELDGAARRISTETGLRIKTQDINYNGFNTSTRNVETVIWTTLVITPGNIPILSEDEQKSILSIDSSKRHSAVMQVVNHIKSHPGLYFRETDERI